MSETSRVMHVRPDLVSAETLTRTPSVTTPSASVVPTAKAAGWPGYVGAPRHASAALGRSDQEASTSEWIGVAMRILDGADERMMQRYADVMLAIPDIRGIGVGSRSNDESIAAKQAAWLKTRRPR